MGCRWNLIMVDNRRIVRARDTTLHVQGAITLGFIRQQLQVYARNI